MRSAFSLRLPRRSTTGRSTVLRRPGAAVVAVTALLLAACAPGVEEPSVTEAASAPSVPVTAASIDPSSFRGQSLTYVYFTDGPDEQATRTAIGEFEQATGATVNLQIVPFADLEKSLQARLSGGDAPDVARVADWHPYEDQLLQLDDQLGSGYAAEFIEGSAASSKDATGRMVAVPSDLTMNGPLVNVAAFEKAGVALPTADKPWNWERMIADATEVQKANDMESAIAIDKSGHRLSTVLSQFGTRIIGPDGQESLDQAKAEKVFTLLSDQMNSGGIEKDFWLESGSKYKGANDMFLAGAVPVYISGNWQVAQFAKSATFDWAAVPNPCEEACGGFPGGKYMVGFKASKNPQLAAYFLQFMNTAEQQTKIDPVAGWLPTRQDLVEKGIDYPERGKDMQVFLDDVKKTAPDDFLTVSSPVFGASATVLVEQMSAIAAGQVDVSTAVSTAKKEIAALVQDAEK